MKDNGSRRTKKRPAARHVSRQIKLTDDERMQMVRLSQVVDQARSQFDLARFAYDAAAASYREFAQHLSAQYNLPARWRFDPATGRVSRES